MRWRPFEGTDRSAFVRGAIALAVIGGLYPIFADAASRPLAVFVLPCLLTAVLGGWRPTVLVGLASLAMAVVLGVIGPLDTSALIARWLVIVAGVVTGAVGAAMRERQAGRLADLGEAVAVREAFERGLAPAPIIPDSFVAAARYRPAESRMHLGGDFMEAVTIGDGRLAVLIGDVCGHGPREAAVGTALRAGWKGIALSDKGDPVDWIDALNAAFFQDGRIDTYVTMCTGYLDRNAGVIRLVNAGHPPPATVRRPTALLDVPPSPPLGLGFSEAWTATELAWSGEPLLFYTDGLTDNAAVHGPPRRWGEAGLLAWLDAQAPDASIQELADALLAAATAGRHRRDDIALLVVGGAE